MVCGKCKKNIDTYPCYVCGYEGKEGEKQVSNFSFSDCIDQVFHVPYAEDVKKEAIIILISCIFAFIFFLLNIQFFKGKDITVPISFGVNPFAQLLVCIFFGIFLYYHRKTSLLTSFVGCVVIASFNFFITALMLFRQTYSFVYVILLFYLLIRVITSIFMNKISSYWLLSTIFVSFATVYSLLACTMMIICS